MFDRLDKLAQKLVPYATLVSAVTSIIAVILALDITVSMTRADVMQWLLPGVPLACFVFFSAVWIKQVIGKRKDRLEFLTNQQKTLVALVGDTRRIVNELQESQKQLLYQIAEVRGSVNKLYDNGAGTVNMDLGNIREVLRAMMKEINEMKEKNGEEPPFAIVE